MAASIKDLLEMELGGKVENLEVMGNGKSMVATVDGIDYEVMTYDNALKMAHNLNYDMLDNEEEAHSFVERNGDVSNNFFIRDNYASDYFMEASNCEEDEIMIDNMGIDTDNADGHDLYTYFSNMGCEDQITKLPLDAYDLDAMAEYIEDCDGHVVLASYDGDVISLGKADDGQFYECWRVS